MITVPISKFKVGETVRGFYLIKWKDTKTNASGKPYIDYTFTDVTGTVNGKHWTPEGSDFDYAAGEIVKLEIDITEFNGSIQAKVQRIRRVNDSDEIEIDRIVPSAPYPPEKMLAEIEATIARVKDDDYRELLQIVIERSREKLLYYPAAKANHHSIRAGLLYHLLRMLRAGLKLCEVYASANPDLVVAGIVLHDMEKLNEMAASEYGIVDEYTSEGVLLGHIIMGIKTVSAIAEEIGMPREKAVVLEHLILTHHYYPEYGSPKKPMIIEGEILHHVDMLDATIYDMELALSRTEEGEFSVGVPSLERRRIYKVTK